MPALPRDEELRQWMVEQQIIARGITDRNVIDAMRRVCRALFVPPELISHAYDDTPVPIGEEQTISQPYIVALMTQAAQVGKGDRVLEIGTGSGYQAAILAEMGCHVTTIERISSLASFAQNNLEQAGYSLHVITADGTKGYRDHAPYDAILVTAGAPVVPESLKEQLSIGGRLIIPAGDLNHQTLIRVTKIAEGELKEEELTWVRFVPLIGEEGWEE